MMFWIGDDYDFDLVFDFLSDERSSNFDSNFLCSWARLEASLLLAVDLGLTACLAYFFAASEHPWVSGMLCSMQNRLWQRWHCRPSKFTFFLHSWTLQVESSNVISANIVSKSSLSLFGWPFLFFCAATGLTLPPFAIDSCITADTCGFEQVQEWTLKSPLGIPLSQLGHVAIFTTAK